MKIFAMEYMRRQYEIDGLPYDVDLFFNVYKLAVEIYEDANVYYDEETHQIRQKLIENLDFTFVRIHLVAEILDLDVKVEKIYNQIKESSVKLAINSAEKLLK